MLDRAYRIQASSTARKPRLGPDIADAMLVLGFEHRISQKILTCKVRDLGCAMEHGYAGVLPLKKEFYPYQYQISDLAHVLGNLFGRIPVDKIPEEVKEALGFHTDEFQAAWLRLERSRLNATMLYDMPGIGKTNVYLMAIQ